MVHDRKYQEKIIKSTPKATEADYPTHVTQNSEDQYVIEEEPPIPPNYKEPEDGDTFMSARSLDAGLCNCTKCRNTN